MEIAGEDKFHWAQKVSRRDIRRLYDSEAAGMLDEELLDQLIYAIHARVVDMFEVRQAQTTGQVRCRNCREMVADLYRMGGGVSSPRLIRCNKCGWEVTCGEFYRSYNGKDMLPASRKELFKDFLARFDLAHTSRDKMLLLDWLIHEFHMHQGISGRLVAQNVIQGSRAQLIELISALAGETGEAAKQAWMAEKENPLRKFRMSHSQKRVKEIARGLGIKGYTKMQWNELVAEIYRLAPEMFA